jgi:hypothetical protein
MYYEATSYMDEFWGAKVTDYEYELFEDYTGEVFDLVKQKIDEELWDEIPETIEVEVNGSQGTKTFEIDVYEWLSDREIKELEDYINGLLLEEYS